MRPKLAYMRKADLERVYKLPVFTVWAKVPSHLITRTQAQQQNFNIEGKEPVAIKSSIGTKSAFYLYDKNQ